MVMIFDSLSWWKYAYYFT